MSLDTPDELDTVLKRCCSCDQDLLKTDFYHNQSKRDNLSSECKICVSASNKKRADYLMFGGLRESVIIRDGERCVECGMTRQEHKDKYRRDITVDHKDGMGRNTPQNLRNNDFDNLQTLCLSCHGAKDITHRSKVKLNKDNVQEIKKLLRTDLRQKDIALMFSITDATVSYIKHSKYKFYK